MPPSPMHVAPTTPSSVPRSRRASSAPATTQTIVPRWLIMAKRPSLRAAAVDVAVAGAHGPERRAEVGARAVEERFAEGEAAGHVADERAEDIALAQSNAERGAEGFLAGAEEHAAVDLSGAVEAGDFFLERPRQEHPAEGVEVGASGPGACASAGGASGAGDRNHREHG